MVGFDVVFDIVVKILVSLLLIVGTAAFVTLAIAAIATGASVMMCIFASALALFALFVCGALCASAQGQL